MNDTRTPAIVAAYLSELDAALAATAPELRAEILAGIREELGGLDEATAAARIAELGDPVFIAAEANDAAGDADSGATTAFAPVAAGPASASSGAPVAASGASSQRWYIVLAALLVMIGGYVLPVVGFFVGLALVIASPAWTRREKILASAVPIGIFVLTLALFLALRGPGTGVPSFILFAVATFAATLFAGIRLLRTARA